MEPVYFHECINKLISINCVSLGTRKCYSTQNTTTFPGLQESSCIGNTFECDVCGVRDGGHSVRVGSIPDTCGVPVSLESCGTQHTGVSLGSRV